MWLKSLLGTITFLLLAYIAPATVFAANDCPSPGFESTGCFSCWYNDSIGQCSFGGNPNGDTHCELGFFENRGVCDSIGGDFSTCNAQLHACITNVEEKYFCQDGVSCAKCDNVEGNSTPDCSLVSGAGYPLYNGIGLCLGHCPLTGLNFCEAEGGTCKSFCEPTDTQILSVSNCIGTTPVCCKPLIEPPAPGSDIPDIVLPCDPLVNPNCNPTCTTDTGEKGIRTAIGCISFENSNNTAAFFLRWGAGIIGGIDLLLLIYAFYIIMTSKGDPKRLLGGKELLTSALAGAILLLFAVFILRFVGINILGIL